MRLSQFKKASVLKLTTKERAHLSHVLAEYTLLKPAREEFSYSPIPTKSIWMSFSIRHRYVANVLASVVIILVITGGTSFAAEGSLPGDILYPVKTVLNESVKSVLVIGPQAEVKWETEKISRRLDEAEELAVRGDLDEETSAILEEKVGEHLALLEEKTETLESEGDATKSIEAISDLEARLNAHISVVAEVAVSDETASSSSKFEETIQNTAVVITQNREALEQVLAVKDDNAPDIAMLENKLEVAQTALKNAQDTLAEVDETTNSNLVIKAGETLSSAENSFVEATDALDKEEYDEVYSLLSDTVRTARESEVTARQTIKLGLTNNPDANPNAMMMTKIKPEDPTSTTTPLELPFATTTATTTATTSSPRD